ncbi:RING/FYVE/PHD zinc finger superfamily protein [Rhynchospora pubera]|uniref:RING/FYVE/PHD zinc finger superfamily protein n=1 Tax=Rhynchospora pubera TaxID=906938 RepID=A0AAV8E439_9POAL|nr:RING/FYVE/PHD zinc finger superfamily protein [Rhynchospora pubera]
MGETNMSGCDLKRDTEVETTEGKAGEESCKNVKGESRSRFAKSSLVSNENEENMTPDTVLEDGNGADKMTSKQEHEATNVDMADMTGENGKNPSSSADEKEKTTESENSEEVEDDVKVCDICGDVGQEDMLAFCTRCSDGAEHTYCMRVQRKKLPEGEWLCEECEVEVQAEKQKEKQKAVAKYDERKEKKTDDKVSEKKPPRRLNSYFQRKEENQEELKKLEPAGEKKVGPKLVSRKKELKPESADPKKPESADLKKKQPAETKKLETTNTKKFEPTDSKKMELVDTKRNLSVPTCENSVYDSDLDKGKLATSAPRGILSKSTSFKAPSSKIPKVKQITEVPQNPKTLKDPVSSNILRKEPDRIISKSSSFKNPNQSATTETLKKPPPKEPKDKNLMNNTSNINSNNSKGTSILGRPSIGILSSPKIDSSGAAISQGLDNGLPTGRNEIKKPNIPKPLGSLLPRPDDISTCSLLDSILQKNVPLATPRTARCQRCNEMGHAIQSCPKDPTRMSALKPLSERNAKEGVVKRPKFMDQKELENATPRIDQSNSFKIDPAKICSLVPVVFDQLKSTIIPEVDSIWQGGFELVREGKPPDIYDGFQAHFSSCVSSIVPEIVKGFPLQVQLEEVPRQKTWPVQFQEEGPTESNIAIYFFARDRESYENCYIKLVESMHKNDLALRGKFDAAELLIFSSNLLPEYSRRWNKLYYLWGIFKGSTANISKVGPVLASIQDLNHCNNKESKSSSKSTIENCLKDKPDVKEADAESKKLAKPVSVSPPFVDLNLCEDPEPEPEPEEKQIEMVDCNDTKKAVAALENENWVGTARERFCEKTTDQAVKSCDNSVAEETLCVRSSYAESSIVTSSVPEYLLPGSSNSPSLTEGDKISVDMRASRKRSSSMEPASSPDWGGIEAEKQHKKAKTDNGDLNFLFSRNHVKPMEESFNRKDNTEMEKLPPQSSKSDDFLFPALVSQNQQNFSRINSADETMVPQNLCLESPPRETSTPDLELALGDTKKSPKKGPMLPFLSPPKVVQGESPKKGPMLPFLSPPKVNVQGDGSNSRAVKVLDETASLSLSLGFSNALSDKTGEVGPDKSSGNRDLFSSGQSRDS